MQLYSEVERSIISVRRAVPSFDVDLGEIRIEPLDWNVDEPFEGEPQTLAVLLDSAYEMVEFATRKITLEIYSKTLENVGWNQTWIWGAGRSGGRALGGADLATYAFMVFDIALDEALIVDMEVTDCLYWGAQLSGVWWQTLDYAWYQSSLSMGQARRDAVVHVRYAVSAVDAGVTNWLETVGGVHGGMLMRWYDAEHRPSVQVRKVKQHEIDALLSPETQRYLEFMETESVAATWSAGAFVSAAEAATGIDAILQTSLRSGCDWSIGAKKTEIAQEWIDRPLFVVGMPRGGATLAHRLLATDPGSRYLTPWEMRFPTPAPRRETYHSDPRIRLAVEWLQDSGMSDKNFGSMHEFGAQLPDECQHFSQFTCRAASQAANIAKPSFFRWLDTGDLLPAYVLRKKVLKHLQSGYRGDYLVLKSPQHVMHMTELLEVYSDAKIVVMHRAPRKVMASTVSIATKMQGLSQRRVDFQVECDKYLR